MNPFLSLFNALTGSLEPLKPFDPNCVQIYCCGPTVYDVPHLGHARTYVFLDSLQRTLRHVAGYHVRCVLNVTDLDDKIIAKGGPCIAQKYEHLFFETMDRLNIQRPDLVPKTTDCINYIKEFSENLVSKKFAYYGLSNNKNIYFNTKECLRKFNRVFPLSERRDDGNMRMTEVNQDKHDPRDFVLWKTDEWMDAQGNVCHERPGWHVQCAAMANLLCHSNIDIHLGGIDLQFPHHENEIYMGRLYTQKKWVQICMYTGHLHIQGHKMSKSLKNFITVEEMISKGYPALCIRYLFLKHPYDKPMNFSEEELRKAKLSYENLLYHFNKIKQRCFILKAEKIFEERNLLDRMDQADRLIKKINTHLMLNINVPNALKVFEDYVRDLSAQCMQSMSFMSLHYCFNIISMIMDKYFGLLPVEPNKKVNTSLSIYKIFSNFRSKVRKYVLESNLDKVERDIFLKACDDARDQINEFYVTED